MIAPFHYPTDPLMLLAWRDCLTWAIGYPPLRAQFATDTGTPLQVNAEDEQSDLIRFIDWFNANVWGNEDVT